MRFSTIHPAELYERMLAGEPVNLIDVRSPREYNAVHAVGARLIPLDTLHTDNALGGPSGAAGRPVYVICRSGARSEAACARLRGQGLDDVVNVEGGTMAWQAAGLPVEGTDRAGSANWLRMAGLVGIVAGLVLSFTVNPAFAFAAAGIWLVLTLTGNGLCCSSGACSIRRPR